MQSNSLASWNTPLTAEQIALLEALAPTLSVEQAQWVSGYLAGLHHARQSAAQTVAEPAGRITILYGSETGNAEGLAELARARAEARGLAARVCDMADYRPRELKQERLVLVITATHGEGDPPDPAEDFYAFVQGRKAPALKGTRFAVLGLGDSSYEHFCQTAKDFDTRLEALGAERLCERVDCDVDYETQASVWIDQALDAFAAHLQAGETANAASNVVALKPSAATQAPAYDKNRPFGAELLDSIVLNGRGSDKETRHIELSLEDSGIRFEPGDSLAVVAHNDPQAVDELIQALGLSRDETVELPAGRATLEEALTRHCEITLVTPPVLQAYAALAGSAALEEKLIEGRRRELMAYLYGRHMIDIVREFPAPGIDAQAFVGLLRGLRPREYSIASSHSANPDEVHLTVAAVRYDIGNGPRAGVASTQLIDRLAPGERIEVYVQHNKNFKLPADPSAPIIMVGPGTGVAPFRAFLEEREYQGHTGRSWLFFGDRRFRTDFLYQADWQRWLRDGVLERMSVAWSRDGPDKVYVQHRMQEQGRELFDWLEEGASLYVCGDADRMAPDVHSALIGIVQTHGGRSAEQARDYVRQLQRDRRYQRDVY